MGHSPTQVIFVFSIKWLDYLNDRLFLWPLLSVSEQKKVNGLISWQDKYQYIIVRGLLRVLIGQLINKDPAQVIFSYHARGKPYLYQGGWHFNLSHANDRVVYVFSKAAPVGVDIEYYDRDIAYAKVAKRFFSIRENKLLQALPKEERKFAFFQGWVQKEVVIKTLQTASSIPFANIEVQLLPKQLGCLNTCDFIKDNAQILSIAPLSMPSKFLGVVATHTLAHSIIIEQHNTVILR